MNLSPKNSEGDISDPVDPGSGANAFLPLFSVARVIHSLTTMPVRRR